MHFFWSDTPKAEIPQEELLTEEEMKTRFESVSHFMLEYQKQYFEGLKFSLNMWMLINSGTAISLLNSENKQLIIVAILLMFGVLLTGAASIFVNNAIHNKIKKLFTYILARNSTDKELYINIEVSFQKLKNDMKFIFLLPYICFSCAILALFKIIVLQ